MPIACSRIAVAGPPGPAFAFSPQTDYVSEASSWLAEQILVRCVSVRPCHTRVADGVCFIAVCTAGAVRGWGVGGRRAQNKPVRAKVMQRVERALHVVLYDTEDDSVDDQTVSINERIVAGGLAIVDKRRERFLQPLARPLVRPPPHTHTHAASGWSGDAWTSVLTPYLRDPRSRAEWVRTCRSTSCWRHSRRPRTSTYGEGRATSVTVM